ncbi:MAG TPA: DUF72 domain-containing protein [Kofleriaceae bacterium]|nr:DUF72 domain-containing protein [Kofleriaceae bacterium]
MAIRGYYLGCPGWGMKTWVGRLFPPGTRNQDFLARYAEVFNTVEGNTTFYALPTADTVARWNEQTPSHFRFCFKFPREITHDQLLVDPDAHLATFLDRIAPLGDKIGTLFLQLPPRFDATQLPRLRGFLDALPRGPHYAIEVRAPEFFLRGPAETELLALLRERSVDLVILDTRGIHSSKSLTHAETRARKPNLPVIMRATANQPFVRCVPHEDFAQTSDIVEAWATQVAGWIAEGKTPYFFMHAPDDTFAPENAYGFHARLAARSDVGDLPAWPGQPRQLGLF